MSEKNKLMNDMEMEQISGGAYTGSVFAYTVQEGENLSILAHRYGTSVSVIAELNGIKSAKNVYVGMKLLIPLKA